MLQEAAERAAAAIRDARSAGRPITGLPQDGRPATVEDGYQIQAAFRKLWPDKVAGWKIGATAPQVMAKFGVKEPFCGPIYAADVLSQPRAARDEKVQPLRDRDRIRLSAGPRSSGADDAAIRAARSLRPWTRSFRPSR